MSDTAGTVGSARRNPDDPRVRRTRAALLQAFNQLVLSGNYGAITPVRIAAAAGVGRSTFYEHYASKAALLRHSLTPVARPLAVASTGVEDPTLSWTLGHFWQNRRLTRRLLEGRSAVVVCARLAELIETALQLGSLDDAVPLSLVATGIAAAQLAVIELWLSGRTGCTVKQVQATILANALGLQRRTMHLHERASKSG